MALNIKDPSTDALARRLTALTGESITEAVRAAMQERLDRLERTSRRRDVAPRLQAYVARGRARQTLDDRPEDELLGYDAMGVPR